MSNAGTLTTSRTPNILYFWAPPPTVSPALPPLHYFMEPPPSTPNHEPLKRRKKNYRRKWRRRLFLIFTEPDSSIVSAIFYAQLIFTIFCIQHYHDDGNHGLVLRHSRHLRHLRVRCLRYSTDGHPYATGPEESFWWEF